MDGRGNIKTNLGKKHLEYKLYIKLSNIESNYNMLTKIAYIIGGTVNIVNKKKYVIWVVNNKQEIKNVIKIYDTYPPLTSKKICQLAFLKANIYQSSVKTYLFNRNIKYNEQISIKNFNSINFKNLSYFKE
jgi:hypothetical protein